MKIQRNPDLTRHVILEAAFNEIYLKGFQSASLANILANTGLTKGALYHHFPNKLALGYAVLDEVIQSIVLEVWLRPLEACENPIDCLKEIFESLRKSMVQQDVCLGCPLNNLALEMSPVDEGFRLRVNNLYKLWSKGIADALARAQVSGIVSEDIDSNSTATFIVASLAGCRSLAKNAQNKDVLIACCGNLIKYLEALRN